MRDENTGRVRSGRGRGKVGLLRADGSRCWPMISHPYDCGGGRRVEPSLCPECAFPMPGKLCGNCGHGRL